MTEADNKPVAIATPHVPKDIWVLVSAAFIIALGYGLIAPLLPQFIVSFDVSMAAAGVVVSVFAAARLVFAPASGALVDKLGSRRTYLTGLFTVAITTGAVSLTQAYWQIVALRAVAGLGSTMFTVSAMGLIVKLAPPAIRARCSATYGTAFLLGNIIGPLLGASLSFLGFRWPFFIYGVGVAVAAVVVWVLMPAADAAEEKARRLPPMTLGEAWGDTAFRAALTSSFSHGWINMGVRVSILSLFAATIFTNGAAASGYAMAAFAAGNAAVLQFSGRWADAIGRRPMILSGLVGSAAFTVVMGFTHHVVALIVVSILAGAASGMINPAQQAVLGDIIGSERSGGQVLSAFQMAMDLGSIFAPIVVGLLADAFGFAVAFAVSGAIALIGVTAWMFGREPLEGRAIALKRLPLLAGSPWRHRE